MSRSESSIGRVASARSSSRSVSADMRRAISTHALMPTRERSLVYAKPSRCSSKTRTPMPRSPRAMTASTAPSLISTEPDWASRKNTSPVATPTDFSAPSAASTVASLVSRSLTGRTQLAGGTGERVAREPLTGRVATNWSKRVRSGPVGERATPTPGAGAPDREAGQDPPARRLVTGSLQLAANDDARDADGWLRVGDGRALTVFSASPSRVAEIRSDHVDFGHQLRALPNQCCSPQRLGELAVAYPIALGDLEREVAGHDVDLTAAHLLYKHAVLHRAEDFGGVRRARRDHRVRHSADRQVAEGLAPRVAAPRDA